MKQQRHIQTTRTLLSRFRYWGRKNYAAFASMGREFQIEIGRASCRERV